MKLLLDQNLSYKLAGHLAAAYPGSKHVRDFGLARTPDPAVWSFAASQGFLIVSKDVDFQQRALLMGHPPTVIWIRLGNCRTTAVATLLHLHHSTLLEFEADPSASFIALG
jgi:predicted nuclease of predicted toxin-antitoxin system